MTHFLLIGSPRQFSIAAKALSRERLPPKGAGVGRQAEKLLFDGYAELTIDN